MKLRHWLLTTLLLVVALVITACGGAAATPTTVPVAATEATTPTEAPVAPTEAVDTPVEPTADAGDDTMGGGMGEMLGLEAVDPLAVEGDIAIAGSSTVYPLTVAVVERFQEEGYAGNPTIDSVGTGGGFEAFCVTAETDIANASRPINAEEAAACEASGRPAIEFRVGTDALAVVVNPDNPVSEITLEQLAGIYDGTITNWNEIDSAAGDLPIALYSPGTDSGTFDYFVEAVFDDDNTGILAAPGIQFSEDDNVLVQGVEGDAGGIGYFGYAYYSENSGALKILTIDGVEATAETAESNEYPLSRPLFIYSSATVLDEKPQVEAFVNYYLSYVNEVITEVGYFPASDEALQGAADNLLNRTAVSVMEEEEMAEGAYGLAIVDPLAVEGDIAIAGSSTVYPLTVAVVEQFQEEGYAGDPTIDSVGTGGGFEAFCVTAETDIANASRPINEEEAAACEASGRPAIEFRVGTDALAVVVNPDNPVSEITLEQLAGIYDGTITNWNEIDPAAGDLPIALYSPGTDSGTFDYFVEAVLDDVPDGILAATGIQFSEDDNVLVQGVEGDAGGIGYFGYAYYSENAGALKILTIDGVEATAETAESNEYPLSRPLFIYSAESVLDEKPQVEALISYYLQNVNSIITEVGYFPASEEALQGAADNLTNRTAVAMETEGVMMEAIDPLSVEGDIAIAGSSTVYPLTVAVMEQFQEEGYAGDPTIDSVGTGGGFEAFCVTAETDIANASRPINEEEAAACEASGRPAIEFRVGTDALAVVVNPDNPVSEITLEQLAGIYDGTITNWNEIDSAAGDLPIALYSPGTDSGTFDYFVEAVLDDVPDGILAATGIQFSEDDNVLVQGVEGDAGGIGYFGYAYYSENASALKILTIEGVEPTAETAESGDYPLSRPLFIYSAAEVMAEKPQVAAFISYYLQVVNDVIIEVGYFPASAEALNEAAQNWSDAQ